MVHKMLNYSELLRCLLQGQEFIPLSSKLGFSLNFIGFMDLIFTFKEGFGAIISVLFS